MVKLASKTFESNFNISNMGDWWRDAINLDKEHENIHVLDLLSLNT